MKTLPDELIQEKERVIVKLLWVWLRQYGWVNFSHRAIAKALGISQPPITNAMNRLRDLGLIEDEAVPKERVASTFRALDPRDS